MKKNNLMFGFFFLAFLTFCTVPTLCETARWMKKYYLDRYDEVMRKFNIRYYKPAAKIDESLYAGQKEIISWKIPFREKDYSSSYIAKKILQKILTLPEKKTFEDQFVKAFPYRIIFSEVSMAFRKFVGMKRPNEYTGYYLRPDGALGMVADEHGKFNQLKPIVKIKNAAEEVKAKFHVVIRPDNVWDGTDDIYPGFQDKSNIIVDKRIKQLEQAGISVWDMRPQWNRLPNRKDLFFKTDHHWNVYGALKGAEILAGMLNDKYHLHYDIKTFDPDLFQKLKLKKLFLGSWGRILTLEYAKWSEPEDFDLLFPAYETDFTMTSSNQYCSRQGDFSIFLFHDLLRYEPYKIDQYESDPYTMWLFGIIAWIKIVNTQLPPGKGKKLFFIKDSYGSSMLPYLALQTREIMMTDPRTRTADKIRKLILQEKPDLVFWMYSLNMELKNQ